jgi:hypothetical protein
LITKVAGLGTIKSALKELLTFSFATVLYVF